MKPPDRIRSEVGWKGKVDAEQSSASTCSLALLPLKLLHVELQLFSLQYILNIKRAKMIGIEREDGKMLRNLKSQWAYPSALPHWPGREEMQAKSLPDPNCSSICGSSLRSFWRFSSFLRTWVLFLASSGGASPSCHSTTVNCHSLKQGKHTPGESVKPYHHSKWKLSPLSNTPDSNYVVFALACKWKSTTTLICILLARSIRFLNKTQFWIHHLSSFLLSCSLLLPTNINTIMLQVPLLKRGSINLNNCTLHQGLSPNKLIIRRIVNNIEDTCLAGHCLTSPWIVPCVQSQSPPLDIASSYTDSPNSLVAGELGICRLPTQLIPSWGKRKNMRPCVW